MLKAATVEKYEVQCRLWAEIEAHKWCDLELNLRKTATNANYNKLGIIQKGKKSCHSLISIVYTAVISQFLSINIKTPGNSLTTTVQCAAAVVVQSLATHHQFLSLPRSFYKRGAVQISAER